MGAALNRRHRMRVVDAGLVGLAIAAFSYAAVPLSQPIVQERPPSEPPLKALGPGRPVPTDSIDWSASAITIALYVWTSCSACEEGAAFYGELAAAASERDGLRLIVVAPDEPDRLAEWLKGLGIAPVDTARVENPVADGILLFPTLMSVNSDGKIVDLFAGPLDNRVEAHILERYRSLPLTEIVSTTSAYSLPSVPEAADAARLSVSGRTQHLIIEDRSTPWIGPRPTTDSATAVRLPRDELWLRLPYEVDPLRPIAIECRVSVVDCRSAALTMARTGYDVTAISTSIGGGK